MRHLLYDTIFQLNQNGPRKTQPEPVPVTHQHSPLPDLT